jgi:hypothetical protein
MRETLIPSRGKFSQVAKKMLGPLSSCWVGVFSVFAKIKNVNPIWQSVVVAV